MKFRLSSSATHEVAARQARLVSCGETEKCISCCALLERNLDEARNLAFSVLVFGELLRALSSRDPIRPFWELGIASNLPLYGVVIVSSLIQIAIHHFPATERLFQIDTLSLGDCLASIAIGAIPLVLLELTKVISRTRRLRNKSNADESPARI